MPLCGDTPWAGSVEVSVWSCHVLISTPQTCAAPLCRWGTRAQHGALRPRAPFSSSSGTGPTDVFSLCFISGVQRLLSTASDLAATAVWAPCPPAQTGCSLRERGRRPWQGWAPRAGSGSGERGLPKCWVSTALFWLTKTWEFLKGWWWPRLTLRAVVLQGPSAQQAFQAAWRWQGLASSSDNKGSVEGRVPQ